MDKSGKNRFSVNQDALLNKDDELEPNADLYGDDLASMKRAGLKGKNFSAYMVGHVYNDLCATAWFTYMLFFLINVAKLSKAKAG